MAMTEEASQDVVRTGPGEDLRRYLEASMEAFSNMDLDKARRNADQAISLEDGVSDPYYLLAAIDRNRHSDYRADLLEAEKHSSSLGIFSKSDFEGLEFFETSFTTKRTWGINTSGVRISFDGGQEYELLNKQHLTLELMKGRHKVKMKVMGEIDTENTSTLDVDSGEKYLVSYMSIKCIPYLKRTR